ncbi:MAG: fumarylacetoacetate hydrolase family protein [Bacteriovoracia bacterium]
MKFVTFSRPGKPGARPGLRVTDSPSPEQQDDAANGIIIDLAEAYEFVYRRDPAGLPAPTIIPATREGMLTIIQQAPASLLACEKVRAAFSAKQIPQSMLYPEKLATLHSPLPNPPSMRDGYAFRQHVEAARRNRGVPMIPEFDHFPIFYYTNHLAVTGPGPIPVMPLAREKLDFELETAIVIGKGGRNIAAKDADDHIFGYTIMNDWSARHLQMEEMKLNLGPAKGKDFATSLGPYLVTRDELASYRQAGPNGERFDLRMQCWVNDKLVSDGNQKDMTWTYAQIIERVSYGVTLQPGEVIGSGTVGTGCFLELNGSKITDNQWLKPGDRVDLLVTGLGRLQNTITAEEVSR